MQNAFSSILPPAATPGDFLRKVLLADAAVSGFAGAIMALGGPSLQGLLGLPATMLVPAGLSLFLYMAFTAWLARRPEVPRGGAWAAVAINVAWAVDCVAVAIGPWFSPTALGQAFLLLHVLTPVVFAELQVVGLRRARRPSAA